MSLAVACRPVEYLLPIIGLKSIRTLSQVTSVALSRCHWHEDIRVPLCSNRPALVLSAEDVLVHCFVWGE